MTTDGAPISPQVLQRQLIRSDLPLDEPSQRALHWHLANLEFACAAPLTTVSARDWDQDDANEFDGDHCILAQGGYGASACVRSNRLRLIAYDGV